MKKLLLSVVIMSSIVGSNSFAGVSVEISAKVFKSVTECRNKAAKDISDANAALVAKSEAHPSKAIRSMGGLSASESAKKNAPAKIAYANKFVNACIKCFNEQGGKSFSGYGSDDDKCNH